MVSNVQGVGSVYGMEGFQAPQPLSDDQKTQVQSILSKYDPAKITADDAKAIFKSFQDAGIKPAPGLSDTIKAAGFDPKQLRSLSGAGGRHHHHGQSGDSSSGVNVSAMQSLQSILSQYDLTNLSSDQQGELVSKLRDAGLMKSGNTISLSV
jgi:hypothetical protein